MHCMQRRFAKYHLLYELLSKKYVGWAVYFDCLMQLLLSEETLPEVVKSILGDQTEIESMLTSVEEEHYITNIYTPFSEYAQENFETTFPEVECEQLREKPYSIDIYTVLLLTDHCLRVAVSQELNGFEFKDIKKVKDLGFANLTEVEFREKIEKLNLQIHEKIKQTEKELEIHTPLIGDYPADIFVDNIDTVGKLVLWLSAKANSMAQVDQLLSLLVTKVPATQGFTNKNDYTLAECMAGVPATFIGATLTNVPPIVLEGEPVIDLERDPIVLPEFLALAERRSDFGGCIARHPVLRRDYNLINRIIGIYHAVVIQVYEHPNLEKYIERVRSFLEQQAIEDR